jgi:Family of unknown function (DUF6492)
MQTLLEAVLPISDREKVRRNVDRATMTFESLNFFWCDRARPLVLHVVAPDSEVEDLRDAFSAILSRAKNLAVTFRKESEISPVFDGSESRGIAKQMLIKLAGFRFVSSPFYLTLDTDVVACKPFGPQHLIKGGLAVNDWQVPSMTNWWLRSAAILGLEADLSRPRMFVTPQILSTEISSRLATFLQERFLGEDWMRGLMNRYSGEHPDIWTEYTLYDLFAEANGLKHRYHLGPGEGDLSSVDNGVWFSDQFAAWQPELAIAGDRPGYFLVIQSITAHDLEFETVRARWTEAVAQTYPEYRHSDPRP